MKARLFLPAFLAAVSFCLTTGLRAEPSYRLLIIGDSTVCDWPADTLPRGWGSYIQPYFKNTVQVINRAKSGRSTRTFITEGLWAEALKVKPDFVLIQFGHNDSHGPGHPESTDAATSYRDFLRRYIADSRAAGAVPILVTPMCRRTWNRGSTLADALAPYAEAMKIVGAETRTPVIDLHAASKELYERLGPAGADKLEDKPGDRTHFNERGARLMAALVMERLPQLAPRLRAQLAVPPPVAPAGL